MKNIFAKTPASVDLASTSRRYFLVIFAVVLVVAFGVLPSVFGSREGSEVRCAVGTGRGVPVRSPARFRKR